MNAIPAHIMVPTGAMELLNQLAEAGFDVPGPTPAPMRRVVLPDGWQVIPRTDGRLYLIQDGLDRGWVNPRLHQLRLRPAPPTRRYAIMLPTIKSGKLWREVRDVVQGSLVYTTPEFAYQSQIERDYAAHLSLRDALAWLRDHIPGWRQLSASCLVAA